MSGSTAAWLFCLAMLACAGQSGPSPDGGAGGSPDAGARADGGMLPDGGVALARLHGLNFGPYVEVGQDPSQGSRVGEDDLRRLLGHVARYAEGIRTYGSSGGLELACAEARAAGLRFWAGVWIGESEAANEQELANLEAATRTCRPDGIIVGNEALLRGEVSVDTLIAYVNQVKLVYPGIPVTSAEEHQALLAHPGLIAAVDLLWVHYYPYWRGVPIAEAVASLHAWHQQVVRLAGGKEVVVGETGWPSCGDQIGDAVPSPQNAARYLLDVASWARATATKIYYFEAFDEPWKAAFEGPQGACWGIVGPDGSPKPGNDPVFRGVSAPDTWTVTDVPGGPGAPELRFTHVPAYGAQDDLEGQALHVLPGDYHVAVYIDVPGWGWVTKPSATSPITSLRVDGTWRCDITTGGVDETATRIKAFLLPVTYVPPVVLQAAQLPPELETNAVTSAQASRAP